MTAPPTYHFGVDYVRDDRQLHGDAGRAEPVVLDLIDLATATYLTDRRTHRGKPWTEGWSRTLVFEFRARQPDAWCRHEVRHAVLELLHWLTEDQWNYLVSAGADVDSPGQMALPVDAVEREVVLFSGGLDSTAGAALLLSSGTPVLGAAVATNERMKGYQRSVARALAAVGGWDFRTTPGGLSEKAAARDEESTRRTRGFVFLAVGWATAAAARRTHLLVLENGVGAINLPFTAAQTGCMTSRAVHPRTLELAQHLFSLLQGSSFAVVNPHLADTKTQMLARLPEQARPACAASESCDNAAVGRGEHKRCGRCSSCLLRRMSLHACGRDDWDSRPYRDRQADGPKSDLREMLWQAARLHGALDATDPAAALVREFPQLRDIPDDVAPPAAIVDLYSTYVHEWRSCAHPLVRRFLPYTRLAG